MMYELAREALWVLGVFILVGGLVGFVRGKSKASLIAGVVCSVLLVCAYFLAFPHFRIGLALGDLVAVAVIAISVKRLSKTKRFMPSGLIMAVAAVAALLYTTAGIMFTLHGE